MEITNYLNNKTEYSKYLPCIKGLFANHLATGTLILIIDEIEIKDKLQYSCLVWQQENKEVMFCSVTYSEKEVVLSNFTLQQFISTQNEITGVQLELF